MSKSSRISRRSFLGKTALSLSAAPLVAKASVFGANDRIVMGCIGLGGQGRGDMGGFLGFPEVRVVSVCDVVENHRNQAKKMVDQRYGNADCQATGEFREVLQRQDIDAVLITPACTGSATAGSNPIPTSFGCAVCSLTPCPN